MREKFDNIEHYLNYFLPDVNLHKAIISMITFRISECNLKVRADNEF